MLQISSCPGTVGLSQDYKESKSEIGMLPWNQKFPQFCWYSIDVLLKQQTINYMYVKIRSVDTLRPQSRVENDKYKQLYDMVQKSSSREISSEQYTRTLGFKYQTRTEV